MNTEPELLNERLERLALVLDEIMPRCASLVRDALALLKEQEPVEPSWSRGKPFCGACGLRIHGGKFCSHCGRPVKWND